jgi:hypothetical protein
MRNLDHFVPQFPDVTEINGIWHLKNINTEAALLRKGLSTQFMFATSVIYSTVTQLYALGFHPLALMRNNNPVHGGEKRLITFWWKQLRKTQKITVTPIPKHYIMTTVEVPDLAAGCCGFKLLEDKIPLTPYFSLLRMPLAMPEPRLQQLSHEGYRLIDTGSLATFWLNGDPIGGGRYEKIGF